MTRRHRTPGVRRERPAAEIGLGEHIPAEPYDDRLAARDLRRRPAEAMLLVLAITAATTTLTLGLVVHEQDAHVMNGQQQVLLTGSWLLGVLAVASVVVLVGGRMADQTRRVGLLKAVGGTPQLVAACSLPSTWSLPCSPRRPG
jgi:hypothetical protein